MGLGLVVPAVPRVNRDLGAGRVGLDVGDREIILEPVAAADLGRALIGAPGSSGAAAGLVALAIARLLPVGSLARDLKAARELSEVVALLEGVAAILDGGRRS